MASVTTKTLRSLGRACHCKNSLSRISAPRHCVAAASTATTTSQQTRQVHVQPPRLGTAARVAEIDSSKVAEFADKIKVALRTGVTLKAGDTYSMTKTITQEQITLFSEVTGDFNPIHLDEEFAKTSRIGRIVGQGAFTTSMLIGIMANKIPGGMLLSYEMSHPAPYFPGDTLKFQITIDKIEGRRLTLDLKCFARNRDDTVVAQGTVYGLAPKS